MWNSGGKNALAQAGSGIGDWLFSPRPMSKQGLQYAEGQIPGAFGDIDAMAREFAPIGEELMQGARGLDVDFGEDALFGQAARRWREQMLPGMSARGLTTSGRGLKAEMQGMEDLSTKFGERRFERGVSRQETLQKAATGMAMLRAMPVELRQKLIDILIRQTAGAAAGSSIGSMMGGAGQLWEAIA